MRRRRQRAHVCTRPNGRIRRRDRILVAVRASAEPIHAHIRAKTSLTNARFSLASLICAPSNLSQLPIAATAAYLRRPLPSLSRKARFFRELGGRQLPHDFAESDDGGKRKKARSQ